MVNNKRIFDIAASIIISSIICIPMFIVAVMVKLTSKGPVLHWSYRIGINNSTFKMPKFRTMRIDTPAIATHMLERPDRYLTPIGPFLRKFSLDEFPQLWSVLSGDMSFVGPRPALYNQDDLIELRTRKGIDKLVPGITGWAQVNGRDNLVIPVKVEHDEYYLKNMSFLLDIKILWMTCFRVLKKEGVKH